MTCTKKSAYFYRLNTKEQQATNIKTIQAVSEVRIGSGIDQFYCAQIESNTSVASVHGSVFNLVKAKLEIKEGVQNLEMPSA